MIMEIRKATEKDLPYMIAMLADDALGSKREDNRSPLPSSYLNAFKNINADPNQELISY